MPDAVSTGAIAEAVAARVIALMEVADASRRQRIDDLLEANNRYLEEARAARAELKAIGAAAEAGQQVDATERLRLWIWEQIEKHGDDLQALQPAFDLILNKIDEFRNAACAQAKADQ